MTLKQSLESKVIQLSFFFPVKSRVLFWSFPDDLGVTEPSGGVAAYGDGPDKEERQTTCGPREPR